MTASFHRIKKREQLDGINVMGFGLTALKLSLVEPNEKSNKTALFRQQEQVHTMVPAHTTFLYSRGHLTSNLYKQLDKCLEPIMHVRGAYYCGLAQRYLQH